MKTILLSGGADPIHVGHVRMMVDATRYGRVIVALNSDAWLIRKKGYVFMPFVERKEIIEAIVGLGNVYAVDDADGSVCEAVRTLRPDYFGNGGDRTDKNTPEKELCEELGVELVWNVGGEKVQSSSDLVSAASKAKGKV